MPLRCLDEGIRSPEPPAEHPLDAKQRLIDRPEEAEALGDAALGWSRTSQSRGAVIDGIVPRDGESIRSLNRRAWT